VSATIDDITINYEEDGVLLVKELDKVVLIIFRYQQWERQKQEYGPDRYTVRRYQKRGDEYLQKSKFNISSRDQAAKIVEALQGWL